MKAHRSVVLLSIRFFARRADFVGQVGTLRPIVNRPSGITYKCRTVCGLPPCGAGCQPAADWESACRHTRRIFNGLLSTVQPASAVSTFSCDFRRLIEALLTRRSPRPASGKHQVSLGLLLRRDAHWNRSVRQMANLT